MLGERGSTCKDAAFGGVRKGGFLVRERVSDDGSAGTTTVVGMTAPILDHLLEHDDVQHVLEQADQSGTMRSTDLAELVDVHSLADLEVEILRGELEQRGIDIVEVAAQEETPEPGPPPPTTPTSEETTTDALQLFLREAGRHALLTAAQEVELAKRVERGDMEAKQRMIQSNLRLVVSIAKHYRNQGLAVPRPDPGGNAGADPRRGEVRLASRLQVLDLRDLVDPPGGGSRARRQGADDPACQSTSSSGCRR